jgi:hypothetical protein
LGRHRTREIRHCSLRQIAARQETGDTDRDALEKNREHGAHDSREKRREHDHPFRLAQQSSRGQIHSHHEADASDKKPVKALAKKQEKCGDDEGEDGRSHTEESSFSGDSRAGDSTVAMADRVLIPLPQPRAKYPCWS